MKRYLKFLPLLLAIGIISFLVYQENIVHILPFNSKEIDPSLNNYDFINMRLVDEYKYIYEDDNYYSVLGVDVSEHQGDIDFYKLKDQGIEFVYIRLGNRGYFTGSLHVDSRFEEYYMQAKQAGLKVGVYCFSAGINKEEIKAEADLVLKNIKDKEIDLDIVYDLEAVPDYARINSISYEDRCKNAKYFLDYISEHGYKARFYTNLQYAAKYLDMNMLKDYPFWLAQYNVLPTYKNTFDIWQYSDSCLIEGIDGYTDINIMFVPKTPQTNVQQ